MKKPKKIAKKSPAPKMSGHRLPDGRFTPGYEGGPGRKKTYETPEELYTKCVEYFKWVHDNPLKSSQVISFRGVGRLMDVPKMRAMTLNALNIHLGIVDKTWYRYRDDPDFSPVCSLVEQIIRAQKFEGAAADLLNANIIARDLGLADKSELSGPEGGAIPLVTSETTPQQAAEAYALLREASKKS